MDILQNCPDVLTVMEAAEISRIGRTMMYKFVKAAKSGTLKSEKILIPRVYLQDFLVNRVEKCYNDIQMAGTPTPVVEERS